MVNVGAEDMPRVNSADESARQWGVVPTSRCRSGYSHLRRQMLFDGIPPEAELQPDLDVGTPLGVELLSTLEVVTGEASPATGRLRGLAAGGTDGGLGDANLRSDLTDRHTRAGQIEDLLLLRCANRTAGRVADAAGRRGLAGRRSRRYASHARFRNHLARDETLAEGEQGLPVICVELAEAHHSVTTQTLITDSWTRHGVPFPIGSASGKLREGPGAWANQADLLTSTAHLPCS